MVKWLETFVPNDSSLPPVYTLHSWTINGTKSEPFALATSSDGSASVTFLPELAVDANRDGVIKLASEDTTDATSSANPYRFWLNDDNDHDDVKFTDYDDVSVSPIPFSSVRNSDDNYVNGIRDLVDFFPVFLDVKAMLAAFPPSSGFKYNLKQANAAVNFVFTGLTRANAQQYQYQNAGNIFSTDFVAPVGLDSPAESSSVTHVTVSGIDLFALSPAFLDAIQNHDGGVILVEGRLPTTEPLVLSVETADGTVVSESKLWLSIDRVDNMFRYYNIRPLANGSPMTPENTGPSSTSAPPPNDPFQGVPNRKNIVFIHGFNVDGKEASGTISEMFKRMYWSGSKANFYGVLWRGDDVNPANFQLDVGHAWQQAQHVRNLLTTLQGDTAIIAHSLGNMVAQIAMTYEVDPANTARLRPASRPPNVKSYFAIDAAVPLEALRASERSSTRKALMRHHDWDGYDERLWPTEWHQLFAATPNDGRNGFTWLDVLNRVDIGTNFYSSGDQVLDNPTDDSIPIFNVVFNNARWAWVAHEKSKGGTLLAGLGLRSVSAGWVFNGDWFVATRRRTANEAREADVPSLALPTHPFFQYFQPTETAPYYPGYQGNRLLAPLEDANADDEAQKLVTIAKCLGEAIPSLSFAQGRNPAVAFDGLGMGGNFNLNNLDPALGQIFRPSWPTSRPAERRGWEHGDYIIVAYRFIYPLFDKMTADGGLK